MTHDVDDQNPPSAPSGEVSDFFSHHEDTGAPSAEQLANLKLRLSAVMGQANVTKLPVKPRRSFLPPELLAVAAVLLLAVLAQLVYLATRPSPLEAGTADGGGGVGAVMAAYRSGDVAGAQHLAASSCTDANCASMSAKLLRAMDLARRLDTLDATELTELAQLDAALSGGVETELTVAIAKRREVPPTGAPVDTDQLYGEARALYRENKPAEALKVVEQCLSVAPAHGECLALKKTLTASDQTAEQYLASASEQRRLKNYDAAVELGRACIKAYPLFAPCYRALGSNYAAVATRDQTASDMEQARKYYERYLELADPNDEYVPKVKAILEQAGDGASSGVDVAALYRELNAARLERSTSKTEAAARLQRVIDTPGAPAELVATARAELAALDAPRSLVPGEPGSDTYQRAYQLKDSDPHEAMRLFFSLTRTLPASHPMHQKAKVQLVELAKQLAKEGKLPSNEARDMYLRAYQLKESDPEAAAVFFRQVLTMVPPDDETYQKAKNRLAELESRNDIAPERAAKWPPGDIAMKVGAVRHLTYVGGLTRVAVGDPEVVDVRTVGNDALELKAVTPGKTTLLVWVTNGQRVSHLVTVSK